MDLNDELQTQLSFLRNELEMFGNDSSYALKLAATVRVLVHDTFSKKGDKAISISLLTHLLIKNAEQLKYLDSKAPRDAFAFFNISNGAVVNVEMEKFIRKTPYAGLVSKFIKMQDTKTIMEYRPQYEMRRKLEGIQLTEFDKWWNGVVYDNKAGVAVTRKDIILTTCHKFGGAHIDVRNIPEEYLEMKNNNYLEITVNGDQGNFDNSPLYSSVAQISWELLNSIELFLEKQS